MIRWIAAAAVMMVTLWLVPAGAQASCAASALPEQIERAQVILYGTVAKVTPRGLGSAYYSVVAQQIYKGSPKNPAVVYRGEITSVDYNMVAGESYTLYLRVGEDGWYRTDACSGNHEGKPSAEEAKLLGPGSAAPPPGPAPRIPVANIAPVRFWIPWIALGVSVGAVLFVVFVPRWLRRR